MKYMGSKKRLQKHIAPIINELVKSSGFTAYVEPFVGGANMIEAVDCPVRIGYDNNKYLIAILDYVSKNGFDGLPERIDREHYIDVRNSFNNQDGRYKDYYMGYIGFMGSYNGRFFDGGYSGHEVWEKGKDKPRDFIRQTINNFKSQQELIKNVEFYHDSFEDLNLGNCVVYCDPPYKGTKQYSTSKGFDHEKFYQWCRDQSEENIVLISEYEMPDDFEVIWSKETNTNMMDTQGGTRKKNMEKLFVYKKNRIK